MVSITWTRFSLAEMVVGSTTLVLAFSVGVTFVSIVLFTRDFRLAIFTTLTTVLCISTLFGIMVSVLKWEFGPLEAIFLTTFVGLNVDHIVHVAHANIIQSGNPAAKVEDALMHVGSAVLNGAVTTLAASLFLLPCSIYFFVQLGMLLLANPVIWSAAPERVHQENGSEVQEAGCHSPVPLLGSLGLQLLRF